MSSSSFRQLTSVRLKPGVRNHIIAPVIAPVESTATRVPEEYAPAINTILADLKRQLDALRSQVHQARQLASLGIAAATIAHEINNLLTPMLSYAKVALETNDQKLTRKALEITIKNVQTLVQMSEKVLGIAAARVRTNEPVSIRAAAQDAADALCRAPSKDSIRFTIDADDEIMVLADALQIRQVLFNLFLNARQAMKASRSGRLTVAARRSGNEVHVSVKDNGPGIAPELLTCVFEPLQTTKTDASGNSKRCSGLGLTLCRDLIQENGGTLTVESTVGEGTTFHIRLPAAMQDAALSH